MTSWFQYFMMVRPAVVPYSNPKVVALLILCCVLIGVSFFVTRWRGKNADAQQRKLSRSWSSALFWLGVVGLFLIVCRTEGILLLGARFWWILWAAAAVLYIVVQVRFYRNRYYKTLPTEAVHDPRDKYLPGKK